MPFSQFSKHHVPIEYLVNPKRFKISEDAALYLTNTIRVLAVSLVGVFLPIYIFNLSADYLIFSLDIVANGIIWVLFYFILRSFFTILSILLLTHTIFKKWGFGKTIMISLAILILELVLWTYAGSNLYILFIAGIVTGFKVTTYWIPYHIFFLDKIKKKDANFGKATAKRIFYGRIATAISPVIGGLIISAFGFNVLFILSIVLVITAGLPTLLVVNDWKHKDHFPFKIARKAILDENIMYLSLGYLGQGIEAGIYTALWPILMFLVLNNFSKVGFISGISLIVSALMTLVVGRWIDKGKTAKVHAFGALFNAFLYVPKLFANTPFAIYTIDLLERANSPLFSIPNMAISYEKGSRLGKSDHIILRELLIHFGVVASCALGIILVLILSNWRWVFVIPAVGSLMVYFMDLDGN